MGVNIVNVGYDSTNYYILEGKNARLLVDVGWPGTLPKLQACLKRKGLALRDIRALFVTHYHPDHAGLVQELKKAGLKHIVLEEQRGGIALLKSYMKPENGYIEIQPGDNIYLDSASSRSWLAGMGLQGSIISTPGHSDDSASLVLDEGIAFTGDLAPAEWSDAQDLSAKSWQRLRDLKVHTIHPGHGPSRALGASRL